LLARLGSSPKVWGERGIGPTASKLRSWRIRPTSLKTNKEQGYSSVEAVGLELIDKEMHRETYGIASLGCGGHGFAPKGAKSNDMLPMNPEVDKCDKAQELSTGFTQIHTWPKTRSCYLAILPS
jgi:hypothetical protein